MGGRPLRPLCFSAGLSHQCADYAFRYVGIKDVLEGVQKRIFIVHETLLPE